MSGVYSPSHLWRRCGFNYVCDIVNERDLSAEDLGTSLMTQNSMTVMIENPNLKMEIIKDFPSIHPRPTAESDNLQTLLPAIKTQLPSMRAASA